MTLSDQDMKELWRICDECFPKKWDMEVLSKFLSLESSCIFTVRVADEIAAFAMITKVIDQANIVELGVAKKFRRTGKARELLRIISSELARDGVLEITLEVSIENVAAINLYQSTGFDFVGVRRKYYTNPDGSKTDAHIMKSTLTDQLSS